MLTYDYLIVGILVSIAGLLYVTYRLIEDNQTVHKLINKLF